MDAETCRGNDNLRTIIDHRGGGLLLMPVLEVVEIEGWVLCAKGRSSVCWAANKAVSKRFAIRQTGDHGRLSVTARTARVEGDAKAM